MGFVLAGTPVEQMAERPRLRFPAARSVFERLFAAAGFTVAESPAGRFRRLTTELWGGLESLAEDLGDPERFALLTAWLSDEKSGVSPGVLMASKRRVLSLDDALVAGGLSSEETRDLLDTYLQREILQRGLVLKCGHCLAFEWYDMSELSQRFQCHRCREATVITHSSWRGGDEPRYYYDLAEVVFQGLKGHMEVPVRALSELAKGATSFADMPEVEVVSSANEKIEIDLLALADARVILGEAKLGDQLQSTKAQENVWLQRFKDVAAAAAADEVVFATASPSWRTKTAERIHTAFDSSQLSVRLLEGV